MTDVNNMALWTPPLTCIEPRIVCCLPLMMPIMLLLLLCCRRQVHAMLPCQA